MSVFEQQAFDNHEQVLFSCDRASGLRAIIAIHDSTLGPAAGGCRRWHYANEAAAIADALRLSRGMTYKNALAGLPFGGGKAVLLAGEDDTKFATEPQLEAFGKLIDSLDGRYVTAEDVGMRVEDMQVIARQTRHVTGVHASANHTGGDPSPMTALGVFKGIKVAARMALGRSDLEGLRVAVQGLGNVGLRVCQLLFDAGAELTVADIDPQRVALAMKSFAAHAVSVDEILFQDVDVLCPCAMGGILTTGTVARLKACIVAGSANNQLADDEVGERLKKRSILYAPDYVINAGGIISVAHEYTGGSDAKWVDDKIDCIGLRLKEIFDRSQVESKPTNIIADEMARQVIALAPSREAKPLASISELPCEASSHAA